MRLSFPAEVWLNWSFVRWASKENEIFVSIIPPEDSTIFPACCQRNRRNCSRLYLHRRCCKMPLDFCINQTNRRQLKPDSQRGSMAWCCWTREEKQSLKQKHTSFATLRMSSPVTTFPTVDFKSFRCTVMASDPRWCPLLQAGSSSWET